MPANIADEKTLYEPRLHLLYHLYLFSEVLTRSYHLILKLPTLVYFTAGQNGTFGTQ
jgi:hypothetical protein